MQPASDHLGFVSVSPEQTRSFGSLLGAAVVPGDLVLLFGPFGAGKTTLVQGIAAGLRVGGKVTSPSFTLINEYVGNIPLYHIDLFRLQNLDQEMEQAIESCEDSDGVTVVEWPQLLPDELQSGGLRIDMQLLGDTERSLVLHAEGSRWSPNDLMAMILRGLSQ